MVRRGGSNRRRFSNRPQYVRTTADLLTMTKVFMETNEVPTRGEQFADAVNMLAGVTNVPEIGAARLVRLRTLANEPSVMKFLKDRSLLRVMQGHEFVRTNDIDLVLSTDFLEAFLPSGESRSDGDELDVLASKFDRFARLEVTTMFFISVSVVGTLCGWFTGRRNMEIEFTGDVLRRYTAATWGSESMVEQDGSTFSGPQMMDGWNIAEETLKVRMQECADSVRAGNVVTSDEVRREWGNIVINIVKETLAYLFLKLPWTVRPDQFMDALSADVQALCAKMMFEVTGTRDTTVTPEKTDTCTLLQSVRRGAPTMAEMKYSRRTMMPQVRNVSDSSRPIQKDNFFKRARGEGSRLTEEYAKRHVESLLRGAGYKVSGYGTGGAGAPNPRTTPQEEARPNWMRRRGISKKDTMEAMEAWEAQESAPLPLIRNGVVCNVRPYNTGRDRRELFQDEHFSADQATSDNEFARDVGGNPTGREQDHEADRQLEGCIAEALGWRVEVIHGLASNLGDGNGEWLDYVSRIRKHEFEVELSRCNSRSRYEAYWRASLMVEIRGLLVDAIRNEVPTYKTTGGGLTELCDPAAPGMVRIIARKVGNSRLLSNVRSDSTDVQLNKDIATALAGYSLCLGFVSRRGDEQLRTPLHLVMCRSVHLEGEDVDKVGRGGNIDYIAMRLCVNRRLTSNLRVEEEDVINLRAIHSAASILRMYKAICCVHRLPLYFQHVLFKADFCADQPREIDLPTLEGREPRGMDDAVWKYLRNCEKSGVLLDDRQRGAVVHVLRAVGDGAPGSKSCTLVQGAAGAGKTGCIRSILGGILHHSVCGHVKKEAVNLLNVDDGILRCAKGGLALKVLVCCPSNQAVDNILRRIVRDGIPDGKGGRLDVQMVRITRIDYDCEDLSAYTMNKKALPLDDKLFNKDDAGTRRSASAKARKGLASECILTFMTLSMAGSARLQELRTSYDVVIVDESAQALEPDVLIPLVATRARSLHNRLHVVLFGDHNQLEATSKAQHLMRESHVFIQGWSRFNTSLFERLFKTGRVPCVTLNRQYRMSRTIAEAVLPQFYDCLIMSPLPESVFDTSYNQRSATGVGFARIVLLDTSAATAKYETCEADGKYTNILETELVIASVECLLRVAGADVVRSGIGIMAPYVSQVSLLRDTFNSRSTLANYSPGQLELEFVTVDSMQGREKDVMIISGTRSNARQAVGFMDDIKRLNVAMTRGRKLLVITGDFNTLATFKMPSFQHLVRLARSENTSVNIVDCRCSEDVARYTNCGSDSVPLRAKSNADVCKERATSLPTQLSAKQCAQTEHSGGTGEARMEAVAESLTGRGGGTADKTKGREGENLKEQTGKKGGEEPGPGDVNARQQVDRGEGGNGSDKRKRDGTVASGGDEDITSDVPMDQVQSAKRKKGAST